MIKLEDIIPPLGQVKDETFKKLYQNLKDAINEVQIIKLDLADSLQQNSLMINTLESNVRQIIMKVGPIIDQGKGKFNSSKYPKEKERLMELLESL